MAKHSGILNLLAAGTYLLLWFNHRGWNSIGKWLEQGLVETPDPDAGADMYEWAAERLEKAGFRSYDSNWALLDPIRGWMQCRHNMQYWRLQPYFGLGAGAHGYLDGIRTVNAGQIGVYIQKMQAGDLIQLRAGSATVELNAISR